MGMSGVQSPQYYKALIDRLGSYHELAVFRARTFTLMEQTLSKEDYLSVKDYWQAKAMDPNLPVAPNKTES